MVSTNTMTIKGTINPLSFKMQICEQKCQELYTKITVDNNGFSLNLDSWDFYSGFKKVFQLPFFQGLHGSTVCV